MQEVTLYSGPYCLYCIMAKNLLQKIGVQDIIEISAETNPEKFKAMCEQTGTRTVPQIFIGDVHVGGFTDLRNLHTQNKLLPLLNNETTS